MAEEQDVEEPSPEKAMEVSVHTGRVEGLMVKNPLIRFLGRSDDGRMIVEKIISRTNKSGRTYETTKVYTIGRKRRG